jgi:DNA-binding XRE family transcriptional regulator
MTLQVDYAAERTWAQIVGGLRSARLASRRSQEKLSNGMPRLTIADRHGNPCPTPFRLRVGESWECFERRRLAFPLRSRRQALGMSQEDLGELVGVSRDSIQRWELARVPPRPMSCIVWAQKLGYTLALQPIDMWERRLHSYAADVHLARTAAVCLDDRHPPQL